MDLEFLQERVKAGLIPYLEDIISQPFAKISYTDAITLLQTVKSYFSSLLLN